MNTKSLTARISRHGNKAAWATVAAGLLTLATAVVSQHATTSGTHEWGGKKLDELDKRLDSLERVVTINEAYQRGFNDGKTNRVSQ